jgi:uncharacterized protein YciI
MYFAVIAHDRDGTSELRTRLRPQHRAWLRDPGEHPVVVRLGGPLLSEDGAMNGTLLVVEATTEQAVRDFFRDDPYVRHQLFERVQIQQWLWGLGQPEQKADTELQTVSGT